MLIFFVYMFGFCVGILFTISLLIHYMHVKLKNSLKEIVVRKKDKKRHNKPFIASKEEMFYKKKVGDLLRKNHGLLKQARYWKNESLMSRSELRKMQLPKIKEIDNTEEEKVDQDEETQTDSEILEAIRSLKVTADSGCKTMSSENSCDEEDQQDGWTTQKPKRIARLHHVVSQQSQTIQTINRSVSQQREAIARQNKEMTELRKQLTEQQKSKSAAEENLKEMTERVKRILLSRSKEKSQEWRQFARLISTESFQAIRPSGAAPPTSRHNDSIQKSQLSLFGANSAFVPTASSGSQLYPVKSGLSNSTGTVTGSSGSLLSPGKSEISNSDVTVPGCSGSLLSPGKSEISNSDVTATGSSGSNQTHRNSENLTSAPTVKSGIQQFPVKSGKNQESTGSYQNPRRLETTVPSVTKTNAKKRCSWKSGNSTSTVPRPSRDQRYPGKSQRVCPTCNMVFSPSVDPHVIEEHIIFHQVYKKRFHAE